MNEATHYGQEHTNQTSSNFLFQFPPLSTVSNCTVDSCTVETSDGVKLYTKLFKPREDNEGNLVIVLVHPYSVLGGSQALLKGVASGLASEGYMAVTFDMRGVERSTGRPSITGFAEIQDAVAVCKWVCQNLYVDRILLVGSSAGAPIAGSAVDQIEQVIGYVSLGYPFGMIDSILFGDTTKPSYNRLNQNFLLWELGMDSPV
ncbi:alpha/beta-Hydrolases superfamily protein [Quillaja saponaria]|uniref:Alpha/beta-Hydrolases superfamily protein n=1 Tax=Quillaja saponaria TaxID=32244 RepID=A0AAD7PJU9_QUISA|nr:alpha/beta-Hydrolases superfamily protein [Quillaja saponaria]